MHFKLNVSVKMGMDHVQNNGRVQFQGGVPEARVACRGWARQPKAKHTQRLPELDGHQTRVPGGLR